MGDCVRIARNIPQPLRLQCNAPGRACAIGTAAETTGVRNAGGPPGRLVRGAPLARRCQRGPIVPADANPSRLGVGQGQAATRDVAR